MAVSLRLLKEGEVEAFGKLMNDSHVSLRDDYEVTGIELDTLAEEAWKIEGCVGSRMTGAGFGGCTVNIVPTALTREFCAGLGKRYEARTGIVPEFYVCAVGDGARELQV